MALSGTYAFSLNRDSLIAASLRLVQAFGDSEVIPANDITNCAQALNILVKALEMEGLPLWCVQDVSVPLVVGQASYNLSTVTGMNLPVRILDCYLRSSAGNDIVLIPVSRYDYDKLGQKAAQGNPNQYYYDPQVGAGSIVLYNTPGDNTYTLHVVIQRQIQDFNLATDNPDFPQEGYQLLKWCLADEIALDYQAPLDVRQEINQKASRMKDKFFAFQQDQAPVIFQPTSQPAGWGRP